MDTGETSEYVRTGAGSEEHGQHADGSTVMGKLHAFRRFFARLFESGSANGRRQPGAPGRGPLDRAFDLAEFHADQAVIEDILERLANRDVTERKQAEEKLQRTERALRESHAIRQAVTEGTTDAVYVKDRKGRYLMINPAGAAFLGRTVDAVIGQDDTALFAAETARRLRAFDRHIMETGEAHVSDEEAVAEDGVTRIYQSVKAPYRDHEGRVIGIIGISRDITERRQSEERTRFLAEAGRVLAGALDYEETLAAVADLMVPVLADWCAVDLKTPDGALQRVAVAHPDPAKVTLAWELLERYPPDPEAPTGVPHVIRTGRPERYFEVPDVLLVAAARDDEHLRILRELDIHSAIVVPLVARERTLGALTLVMAESGRRFGEADVAFAEDLARRCALSVDNARLYREAREEIARREQAQEALHESERLLRFTLEATRVGTWNWDLQTNDVYWSDNLAAIHRMKPGAFGGTFEAFFADVTPEDRARVQQAIQRAIEQGGDYHVEYRLPAREGEAEVWVEGKGTVLYDEDGQPVCMAGICMDVTERKRAEEELREKTRTLEKEIAERLRAEALVSRQKQVLELIAQGAPLEQVLDTLVRRIEEQTDGELVASILLLDEDGTHLHHGAAPSLPETYNEAIDGVAIGERVGSCGTAAFRRETVVVSDIATDPLWVDFRKLVLAHGLHACWATPILATDGHALGTFAIYYREPHGPLPQHMQLVALVTRTAAIAIERSRAERRLKELNETLEQKVTERTAALAEANQRLEQENAERLRAEQELERTNQALTQRNRELQDFAYVASHDLQEPLRKIRAFADLMAADYQDVVGGSGQYYLDRMQDAARRMSGLISDLLAFSRIATRGRSFEEVDLNKVVAGVLSDLDYAVREVAGRVEVADLPALDADATQMRQLFQNLIGNALKFHKPDVPPVVRIAATQEQGDALLFKGRPVCRITVQDNGIGFDEKYHDRIFSPFQRLHGRSAYPGTGIGLAICRRIVERHHGTITAHSTPGAGATFIVTLPLQQTDDAGDAA